MSRSKKRQQYQLDFSNSGKDLEVGDINNLPIPLDVLKNIESHSEYVEKHIKNGFTSEVFKLNIDGKFYTLKKKRDQSFVKNVDGQTSFLNEVQRRAGFNNAKEFNPDGLESVVKTIYAGFLNGIIFSEWVPGYEVRGYNHEILDNLFLTLFHMEKVGIFEYDLCSGNILVQDNKRIKFFDFGYAYKFDPLTEYNADGKDIPHFHMAERLETRSFMQHLFDISETISLEKALEIYKMEKEIAIKYYRLKFIWLKKNAAEQDIIDHVKYYIDIWVNSIKDKEQLNKLYNLDLFRSFILDVEDDISGKSCNPDTILKSEMIIKSLENNFDYLKTHNALIHEDRHLTRNELIIKYNEFRELTIQYQIVNLREFYTWKESRIHNIKQYYI